MVYINNFINRFKNDSFYRDTFFLFFATMIMNLGSFLYHFIMGRFLGPEQYSILGVILSFVYIFFVGSYVLQTSISKFVAEFRVKNQLENIKSLYTKALKKVIIFGIILFILFSTASFFLSNLLNIPLSLILLFGLSIPFMLLLGVTRGLLQGVQNFKLLGYNFILETFSKFVLGFVLVFLGFNIFGAVFGIIAGYIIPFLFLVYILKKYFSKSVNNFSSKVVYNYSIPVFFVLIFLTLFYSLDVLFVKYYFDSLNAGYYVAVALLGRIVFFASSSIVFVLFPKVVEQHTMGKSDFRLLKKALLLITILCVFLFLIYFFLPKLIVLILFGEKYFGIIPYIPVFAIIMALFSYVYVLSFYNLSINRIKFIYALAVLFILEIALFILFHNTIWHILFVLLGLISATFIFMIIYTFFMPKSRSP